MSSTPPATWIIGSPRSGTTALADMMNRSFHYRPELKEWLNVSLGHTRYRNKFPRNCKTFPLDIERYYGKQVSLNDVYAARPEIKWITCRRDDLAAQIASFWCALRTGAWHRNTRKTVPMIDGGSAEWLRGLIDESNRRVAEFAKTVETFDVVYEDFFANQKQRWSELCDFLGVSAPRRPTRFSRHNQDIKRAITEEVRCFLKIE